MFLFSVTAQELKQAEKGCGKIKHCLSGVSSQRREGCLPLEPALHTFYEIAMPTFSLTAFVPARTAFGSWKPSNVLNITCNAYINHNAQVPEPPEGRRRKRPGNLSLYGPSMSSCISPKITLLSGPKVLGSTKQERGLSVNNLSSLKLLAATFS